MCGILPIVPKSTVQTRTNGNQSDHYFTSVSKFQKCEYGFTFIGATFIGFSLLDAQLHGTDPKASHIEGMGTCGVSSMLFQRQYICFNYKIKYHQSLHFLLHLGTAECTGCHSTGHWCSYTCPGIRQAGLDRTWAHSWLPPTGRHSGTPT